MIGMRDQTNGIRENRERWEESVPWRSQELLISLKAEAIDLQVFVSERGPYCVK